jgi:hypothetical protein
MLTPVLLACAAAAQDAAARDLDPLPYERLSAELHGLADANAFATLVSSGHSRAGRALEGLRLGTKADAPAILLIANLEGPRLYAGAVALDHARKLCAGYASDERVRALLDTTTLFVLPRPNPDAAELCIEALAGARPRFEARATGTGVDNDRDGAHGEDQPEDVDGDGVIAWMRYPDREATWMADPTEPRAMVEADRAKGEQATWKLVVEGRDRDGDERVAEDPVLDAQVARNFAAGWRQYDPAAGTFPTDEPEALALCEFFLAHPEIALVVTYDAFDDLVEKPKTVADDARSVLRVPPAGVLESDGKLLEELGRRYRDGTGGMAKGAGDDAGTFQRFCYEHRGLLTLNTVLWDLPEIDPPEVEEPAEPEEAEEAEEPAEELEKPKDAKKKDAPKPSDDAKRLAWIDAQGAPEAWRFVAWHPFEHPELGPVEIGGFAPFARLLPPADAARAIADKHLEHLLTLGALLPRVSIAECTKEAQGGGVWRVKAVVANDGFLPLFTRSGRRTETTRPARLELVLPDAGKLLAGSARVRIEDLPGTGGTHEEEWLVHGPDGMEVGVMVDTDHAGSAAKKAEVTR